MKLNLRWTKHKNVKIKTDAAIWDGLQMGETQLKIITGGSKKTKEIVMECLTYYNLENHEDVKNAGVIIVTLY